MISVVIPVYNGVKFIKKCYESLIRQSNDDWEAIFIDDGSKDNSLEELNRLSETDTRVKVIHKENEGVAVAREVGIKEARGEYITFLDVDDSLVESALKHFVDNFDSEETDMVIAGINLIPEKGDYHRKIYYRPMSVSGKECVDLMCTGFLRWQLCGKAFRASILRETLTPRGLRSAEDMAVCLQAATNARKVVVLNDCLYNYVQVATSVTHSKAREISYDALKAAEFVEKTMADRMSATSLDCLFLLIISGALRAGISPKDHLFRAAVITHGKLRSITHLSPLKALNVGLYRYLHINLARFI